MDHDVPRPHPTHFPPPTAFLNDDMFDEGAPLSVSSQVTWSDDTGRGVRGDQHQGQVERTEKMGEYV